ncbi:hypothetical protein PUNSTDRAFT_117484 [Punctularia strigosozonata HHB-11173 SS5]|uniref:uncharacterized protein n=1 Tax=Punctularia strigosozonata (strain HHB-11173) TaxID=741275 RepID=UPI00044165EE|nr:uncharacterized protein PUNSTDRAFT_117484 [Punctularia strigosozonata HHB-11173 SS5]EIN13819.1 hypothetical protein PUNSTDRAFT_117484 [Punctularia strigosozonata HHB-11173 SS5]
MLSILLAASVCLARGAAASPAPSAGQVQWVSSATDAERTGFHMISNSWMPSSDPGVPFGGSTVLTRPIEAESKKAMKLIFALAAYSTNVATAVVDRTAIIVVSVAAVFVILCLALLAVYRAKRLRSRGIRSRPVWDCLSGARLFSTGSRRRSISSLSAANGGEDVLHGA